ncbi:MAG: leucine-rich repeat domain-containing protein [Planctomycetes bacterium]|nr:leucine-rich repeat domain-containing protein [Planctomycetota bacterium]
MTTKPNKPKPRRRWWQFSLRTFFVLLTVACVWFGWQTQRARRQQRAVAAVRENSGTVYYNYEFERWYKSPTEEHSPTWFEQIVGIDFTCDVVRVDLNASPVSDVSFLAGLASVRTLHLIGNQVSDITALSHMKDLETLYLTDTPVSNLAPLAELSHLRRLDLNNTPVVDITPLAGLKNLEQLHLHFTQVHDVSALAGLTNLQYLNLVNTQVSREQFEKLQQALPNCDILGSPPSSDPSP